MSPLVPTTKDQIVGRIKSEAPPDAPWVFDCDGTIISGDIASHTAWGLVRFGVAHPERFPSGWKERFYTDPFGYADFLKLREHFAELHGIQSVYEWEALMQSGNPPSMIHDISTCALAEGLKQGSLKWTNPVADLAQFGGKRTWICSGSPQGCVVAVARALGLAENQVLATLLDTVDGIYAPKILPPGIVWEELKRLVLDENGITKPWLVAGDSIGDWQMIEMATNYAWFLVWDEHRHRGTETRDLVQQRILGPSRPLPKEPGIYVLEEGSKTFIFEVKNKDAR